MSRRPAPHPYSVLKQLTPLKITLIYLAINLIWVLLFHVADRYLLGRLNDRTEEFVEICSLVLFVLITTWILYRLVNRLSKEHQRVLEHLSEERNKFQAIIGALGDGVSIQSTDYQVLYQNQVHQALVGGSRVGEYCYKAYSRRDGVCPDCPIAASYRDGKVHRVERAVKSGKQTVYVEILATPLRDASGSVIGGIELVRDVTSRKRTELQLSGQAHSLERLLSVSREITATTDLEALYRKTITIAKQSLGFDCSSIMMLSPDKATLMVVDTLGFPESMINTFILVAGQGLSTYVVTNRLPGTVVDFETEERFQVPPIVRSLGLRSALCVPMTIENEVFGVLIGHTRAVREFTDEEQALCQTIGNSAAVAIKNSLHLSALKESEERYRTLFENAHDMIQCIDPATGRFLFVNPEWLRTLGYSRERLHTLTVFDVLHERDKVEGARIFRAALAGENFSGVTVTFAAQDNRAVVAEGTISSQKERGAIAVSFGFFHDVTTRKQVEEQLRHAQKMEAVGQLAGGIAHDFNNILTAITGYASVMLTRTAADSRDRFTLEQMVAAAKRASALTRAMLTYSRKQAVDLRPINLNSVIQNLEHLLRQFLGDRIAFTTAFTDHDLRILADTGQIEQVLMNMAANARDAVSGQGAFTIKTDATQLTGEFSALHGCGASGSFARLSMSDNGRGMDEKTLGRIFEPFFTTKEIGKGTGLGLSVVYGIVKQHNGCIRVTSEPGKGTTFDIYFPLMAKGGKTND